MQKFSSILDYSFPGIPTDIWLSDGTLNPVHKDFINKLLNSFYHSYDLKVPEQWVTDITVIGSLTTNRYVRSSDFDCHVIVDIDKFIKTNMPTASKEEAVEYLDNARKEWDRAKIFMPLGEHSLELFFETEENPSNIEHVGRYSIFQSKWLKSPIYFPQDLDYEESRRQAIEGAKKLANELDNSFGEIDRQIQRIDELKEVVQAWPEDKRQLYYDKIQRKLDIIEEELEKSVQIKQDLVDQRHLKQDAFSENEIQFKFLARFHYFSILQNLKKLLESTEGEVTEQELPLIKEIISEASIKQASNLSYAYWVDPQGKIYTVRPNEYSKDLFTHSDWVVVNEKLLKEQYGLNLDGNCFKIIEEMYASGWARIGDSGQSDMGYGITVGSLSNIPAGVDIALPQFYKGEELIVEGYFERKTVFISDPFPSLQKAVNKALQQKRLQGALHKKADIGGYWIDPSGKSYNARKSGSHAQWILENLDLLSKKYGINIPEIEELEEEIPQEIYDIWQQMTDQGWTRLANEGKYLAIDVPNLTKLSPMVEDFILNSGVKEVNLSDKTGAFVSIQYHGNLQKTVNKALQHKRMGSLKEAFMKEAFVEEPKEIETDICVDFDRTIAQQAKHPAIGEPIEGAKESLTKLKEMGYTVVIYSCRGDTKEGIELVREWLDKHEMPYDSIFEGEKPFAKFYIDDRAIHFNGNWPEIVNQVEKSEKKASLSIVSAARFWVDPKGKIYNVSRSHEEWIYDNIKLLQKQYGLWKNHPEELYPEETDNIDAIIPMMLRDGWSRVGDLFGLSNDTHKNFYGQGIEIADINNAPESLFDFISNWDKDKPFLIEDLHKRYVELSVEELMSDGQDAINRALQRGKMVHASSNWPDAAWIAPDGQIYEAATHDDWVYNNLSLLKQKYGIDLKQKFGRDLENDPYTVVNYVISQGWVRVGVTQSGKDYVAQMHNIRQIPTYAIDFLLSAPEGTEFYLDDENSSEAVTVSKEELARGQNAINRAIKTQIQSSLNKKADGAGKFWIDPNGKIYPVSGTHTGWGKRNAEKLNKKFGYDLPLGRTDGHYYTDRLLDYGWVRIAETMGNGQFVIHLKDANNIPTFVDYFIAQHFRANTNVPIWVASNTTKTFLIDDPFPNLQTAVNKAMHQPAMIAKALSKKELIAQTKKVTQGDYGCVMTLVPHELAQEIIEFGVRNIPDDVIYLDQQGNLGRELESHVTIKYGITTDDSKQVRQLFNDEKPFHAKLGKIKHFQPPERDFDVVTVEVISEDLNRANKKVTDKIECAEGLPSDEYYPHVTIAYVKRDTGKDYIGSTAFEGKDMVLDTLIFSPAKGNRTYFSISQDKESFFIIEEMEKVAEFLPSLFNAPDNRWQFEHGGPDKEIALQPDPVSDDTTEYELCTTGKPRSPEVWRQFISIFDKPLSKKDVKIEADDKELEEAEKKELGEDETLLEYSKGFYDPKKHDFPHNTTWDAPDKMPNQHEPYSPLPVTLDVVTNPANEAQNSPGGYPNRFCLKPKSEWFSDEGEITPALENMFKYQEAAINNMTRDIISAMDDGGWISPNGQYIPTQDHFGYVSKHLDDFGLESLKNFDEGYSRNSVIISQMQRIFDRGWIRVRVWGDTIFIQGNNFQNIKDHAEEFIYNNLNDAKRVRIETDNEQAYVCTAEEFKENGWNAFLKQPVMAKQKITAITRQYALYIGGRLAIRTLTRAKAVKICRERFPAEFAAGNYEIKEEAYKVSKQASSSILEIDLGSSNLPVFVNPSRNQVVALIRKYPEGLRVIDGLNGDYVWEAGKATHDLVLSYLSENGYEEYSNVQTGYIMDASEVDDFNWLPNTSLKQAGSYSSTYTDEQGEQFFNEQHQNDVDQIPYTNFDQRDTSYGYHDSPENTMSGIDWPKDQTSYVVRLDQLQNPADRNYPPGLMDYEVTPLYNSLPMSDGIEATNPD